MVKYSIKIAPTMFVQHCSDGLFETTSADLRIFTRKECDEIMERLKDRYIYNATLYGTDGSKEKINSLTSCRKDKEISESATDALKFETDDCFTL